MGTGFFGVQNRRDFARAQWEVLKKDPSALATMLDGANMAGGVGLNAQLKKLRNGPTSRSCHRSRKSQSIST
jgi:hypothetical protein